MNGWMDVLMGRYMNVLLSLGVEAEGVGDSQDHPGRGL
jgi:hypothetical protein